MHLHWIITALALCALSAAHSTTAAGGPLTAQQRTLSLVFHYPDAKLSAASKLFLRGSSLTLNWSKGVALAKVAPNTWSSTLVYSDADVNTRLEFKPLVDDATWKIGANFALLLPASLNATAHAYPWFYTYTGSYGYKRNVYSPQLKNYRDLVIYTPPSYFENTLKVHRNVLVMHDGQNLFNASTSAFGTAWNCQDTVNSLVNQGAMDEVVIVGVDNTPDRTYELTYSVDPSVGDGGGGDIYLNFIEQTVLPLVAKEYRVNISNNATVGILGSSLGGLISCYAGYTRSSYGKVGCMSSSFWWNNEDFNNVVMAKPASKSFPGAQFYLDSGDSGPDNDDVTQTKTVLQHFQTLGFQLNRTLFYYLDHGGQHSEYYWGKRFYVPMTDLYPTSTLETVG